MVQLIKQIECREYRMFITDIVVQLIKQFEGREYRMFIARHSGSIN